MDLAELNVKIGADLSAFNAAIPKVTQGLESISGSATKLNAVLDNNSKNLAKVTAAGAATSGGYSQMAANANKLTTALSTIPKSFDEISSSIDSLESEFNSKWNAIIAEAEELNNPLGTLEERIKILQSAVQSFGGGVFSFKAVGVDDVLNKSKLIVSAVGSIPANVTTNFQLSGGTQTALQELGALSTEINDLGNGGAVSIAKINTALEQLRSASIGATNVTDIQKYDAAINKLKGDLGNITTSVKKTGVSLSTIGGGSSTATQSLQNLGRVAQDLPYGFIGIANNLNPLLEGFQRLAAESKATGVSIGSSLLKSLTGAGGLGLALSVVTAALQFATVGLSFWTRGMNSSKKASDDAIQSNEDYAKSLQSIGDSAIKEAEKSITTLNINTKAAQDNTLSLNERIEAVNKLQEQSGYFAALSKEEILYGNITDAINKTTQALFNKAYADAAAGKASEAGARAYQLDLKRREALADLAAAQAAYNDEVKSGAAFQSTGTLGVSAVSKTVQDLQKAKDKVNELTGQFAQAQLDQASFLNDASRYTKLTDNVDKAAIVIAKLNNQIDALNKKSVATGANFNTEKISDYKKAVEDLLALPNTTSSDSKVQSLIAKIKELGGSFDETASRSKRSKTTISDVLADLNKEIAGLTDIELRFNENKSTEKINAILGTIKKLEQDFDVSPKDTIINKLFGDINAIKFSLPNFRSFIQQLQKTIPKEQTPKIPVELTPVFDKENFDDIVKRASVAIDAKAFKVDVDTSAFSGNEIDLFIDKQQKVNSINQQLMKDFGVGLPDSLKNLSDAYDLAAANSNSILESAMAFTDFLQNVAIDSLSAFGEAIGTLLAGGNTGDIFTKFFGALGEGLQSLGKTIIATAPLIQTIKTLLFSNPLAAIPAGLALIALGAFIENKIPKLDQGGIIPAGYPNDSFPALLSSHEAVIPLGKLNQYFTNESSAQIFIPSVVVKGSDLVLVFDREQRKNKRTN